jgi:hypothetical protein
MDLFGFVRMATIKERMMNIAWVLADDVILDPVVNIDTVKATGPLWGSWRTWRAYTTDNVVCHDMRRADELIKREFHKSCNFYIANSVYNSIGRPKGVRLYEGDFMGHDVDNQDEIVSMNLAGTQADIVLLMGFDWSIQPEDSDKLKQARVRNYQGLVTQAVKSRPDVQWILVDHASTVIAPLAELPNFGKDSFANVLRILRG